MGFPARLLADDETLVLSLRPHVKVLFGPVLVLLLVTPVAVVLVGVMPDGFAQLWLRWAVVVVAALILLRWTVWPFVVWWNTVYAVTTRRLVIREGVFAREGHDMPLTRLNDVSFAHGFWDRLLGCGKLVIESAGEHGQIELADIPRIEQVQRTLYRLSDDARTSARGLAERPEDDVDPQLSDRDELPDRGELPGGQAAGEACGGAVSPGDR
ncbi:MAG TPA: PH domain-containing protein [Kineosporiaceae bacterium]|nr:PH domain-containing protein [Kineosporiaceae bacterium]